MRLCFAAQAALVLLVLFAPPVHAADAPARKTENLIVITIDGLRWQDVFDGSDLDLIEHRLGGVRDVQAIKTRFFRDTTQDRRMALMPFFWSVVARQGQVFGDPGSNSVARVTNGRNVSYPGYAEMFCGFAEPLIFGNVKRPNPNLTIFEYLNAQPHLRGKVSAYCTWGLFPLILNADRGGFHCVSAWEPLKGSDDRPLTAREQQLNEMIEQLPRLWRDNTFDVITAMASMEHLVTTRPRVLYIGFGESDEWAHARRYDCYLESVAQNDRFLRQLWEKLQSMEPYAGKTTLLIVSDHGRGGTLADWTDHGQNTPGADRIWMAVLGPDTPALGVRRDVSVTQSQVAATMAELLGLDFRSAAPRAAAPLPDITPLPPLRSRQGAAERPASVQ